MRARIEAGAYHETQARTKDEGWMMDIQNIVNASGLSDGDKSTLGDLVDVYGAVSARNALLDAYYEGEQPTPGIGIDNIPDCVDPNVRSDWARKAVTSVSERVRMDGFTFAGDYTDSSFDRIAMDNDLSNAYNRTVASELTHGCMFATVNRAGNRTAIRMHSAETGAAIWDTAEQRIGAGFVVADESGRPNIIFGVVEGRLAITGINY